MASAPLHRKRVTHFNEPGHYHELTFSCFHRLPLLTDDTFRVLLSHSIEQAMARHHYRLVAFVYMPNHIHLLTFPDTDASDIDQLLRAIKRPFSFRVKQHLEASGSPLIEALTVRQRPGVMTFRFWQEGPGYDRNLTRTEAVRTVIDYIHHNPVRRGLCQRAEEWRWSSARYYHTEGRDQDSALPSIHGLPND
jgi:putative transposase